MNGRASIQYRGYWDFPRVFLTRHEGRTFLFDCAFDDYPEVFKVFLMPDLRDDELPRDWTTLRERAIRSLGEVPTERVWFDATRRQSIDTAVLDELLARTAAAG